MAHVAYFRVSTADQSIESQRNAMQPKAGPSGFDKVFTDEGVSGATPAAKRPGFSALLQYVREGDTVHVYAVDRLGRDALDVQATVRDLLQRGVAVEVRGLGTIARGVGELILAVLAQVADMERNRINERTAAGRAVALASLEATGKTHKGKAGMGRVRGRVASGSVDPAQVVAWRRENGASIQATADHFSIGTATVKRYCAG
jgi:putative DNA-invertase from lambdoid prophage Rac